MRPASTIARLPELLPEVEGEFAAAVFEGLSKPKKTLPCRFFYDARGSELFEEITRLPEYYPTRTEAQILRTHAGEMVEGFDEGCVLIEFGAGSSTKTEILLDRAPSGLTYVPIDVSESALSAAKQRLEARFPSIAVRPIVGDFSYPVEIAPDLASRPRAGFFPGSTIGNLTPADAVRLLRTFKAALPRESRLVIGIDLKKDARQLVMAYNDVAGVTAEFNLNLLVRINRELGSTIDLETFRHEAIYDPREGRIEMHLVSAIAQAVRISGRPFHFEAGERIHTENSYKYSIPQFQELARAASWGPNRVWTDARQQFSVHELISV
jgi:dimethylhistidine N-methyltransferase